MGGFFFCCISQEGVTIQVFLAARILSKDSLLVLRHAHSVADMFVTDIQSLARNVGQF